MVTCSSTSTSLISTLEEATVCGSVTVKVDGVEAEKDGRKLGDEHELLCGLIWVAMSLLETAQDTLVPTSLKPPNLSSVS